MNARRTFWLFLCMICVMDKSGLGVHAAHLSCVVCEPGTYCFNDATYTCPTHSTSLESSGNITACECLPGYHKVDLGSGSFTCESCPTNSYCTQNSLYSCPPNSMSVVLSSLVTDCKCKPGFSGTITSVHDVEACQSCPVGTFKSLVGGTPCIDCGVGKYSEMEASDTADNCLTCPQHSTSPSGSDEASDCLCVAGYEDSGAVGGLTCSICDSGFNSSGMGTLCEACPVSTYASVQGSTICLDCPTHSSHELTGQTSLSSCNCLDGFSGSAGVCTACNPGSFTSEAGTCTLCPSNTYSENYASFSCTSCPNFSTSLQGSHLRYNCTCNEGYDWTGVDCTPCNPGYSKSDSGNNAKYSCGPCEVGTYTAEFGAVVCSPCPNNTFQNLTSQSSCQTCRDHSVSDSGSSDALDCMCLPGYYFCQDCQKCKPCLSGFFKETMANEACLSCGAGYSTDSQASNSTNDCLVCPAHSYVQTDEVLGRTCEACPENSVSLAGSEGLASCSCEPGFTGTNDACVGCEVGKYKSVSGSHSCTLCPEGYIGIQDANLTSNRVSISLACLQCEANTYTSSLSNCESCPSNSQSTVGSNEIGDCKCSPGFTGPDGGLCGACSPGTYKESEGSAICLACPANTYQSLSSATSQASCLACPEHTISASGSDHESDCLCQAGYFLENGSCVSCAEGSYKPLNGPEACTACPTGTYYDGNAPFIINHCKICPANSQDVAVGVGIESCVCQAGYIKENDTCRPCTEGYYCPTETQESQCYNGATASEASSSVNDCVCLPGFYANCTGESCHYSCLLCPVNFYCPGAQSASGNALVACPSQSSTLTLAGLSYLSDCKCNPGWYKANNETGLCIQCSEDTYCVNEQEYECPSNSTALSGTSSITQCYCDEYFTRDAANECHLCGSHLVCNGVQSNIVNNQTVLSPGTIGICSHGASNVNQRCVCQDGSYCDDGSLSASCIAPSVCNACPTGAICSNNQLIQCGENQTSVGGSHHADHCRCKEGYYLTENDECLICPMGAFCTNETLTWCSQFDNSLTTFELGMDNRDHCLCPLGKFRLHSNDTCKTCPRNYYCPSEEQTLLPNAVACLGNEFTVTTGNTKRDACTCAVGFIMTSDSDSFMKCLPCPPGHRCSGGEVLEFFCHLSNRTANADHSECVCQAGFEQDNQGHCAPCQEGYVKGHIGNDACMPCNHDNYYLNTTTCLSCQSNEGSSDDYLSCVCNEPLVRRESDSLCVECAENHYYSAGQCHECPSHSSTNGLSGQSGLDSCTCIPGYHDSEVDENNLTCESCPVGFYEVEGACLSCGTGAITNPESTDVSACHCNATLCQDFVWGDACSGSCEISPVACEACSPGHYKDTVSAPGNTDSCLKCHENQYQPLDGQTSCLQCHETRANPNLGSFSPDDCVCKKGFEELDNSSTPCSACLDGHFKGDIGDYHCSTCAIGSFAMGLQNTACLLCSLNSPTPHANTTLQDTSTHVDNCTCLSGYMLEQDPPRCVECQQGSFKSSPGDHDCRLCGEDITEAMVHDLHDTIHSYGDNEVAALSNDHCLVCPPNSGQDSLVVTEEAPMNEVTDCLCFPAHDSFDASTGCQHCSGGTDWKANYSFKIGYNNQDCQLCEAGKYFEGHNLACDTCVLNDADNATRHHTGIVLNAFDQALSWGTSFEDCDCSLGSTRVADECYNCLAGFYRNDSSLRACQPCGMDEYQDETGQTGCKACPANSYAETTQNTDITHCLCEAGYEWNEDTQKCDECTAGTQKGRGSGMCQTCPENTYSPARSSVCLDCPENERSLPGSGSPFSCNCKPGYGSESGLACSLCANGTFAVGGEGAATQNGPQQRPACTVCPANKNSTQGSTTRANCKCIPGHGDPNNDIDDAATCSPCENGFYASGGSNIACFSCGYGAITDPPQAAFAFSFCQCDAGRGLYEQ